MCCPSCLHWSLSESNQQQHVCSSPHKGTVCTLRNCLGACCKGPRSPVTDGTSCPITDNERINYIYIHIYINSWSWVLLETVTDPQLVKKLFTFYGILKIYYRIRNSQPPVPILSQINPVHASYPTFWKSTLILCFHLRPRHPSGLFSSCYMLFVLLLESFQSCSVEFPPSITSPTRRKHEGCNLSVYRLLFSYSLQQK